MGAAPAGFVITEGDNLDAAHQVREGGVEDEVLQCIAVRSADQLNTSFGDRPGSRSLHLSADLVDHDHFWHVVLHRLNHDSVLLLGGGNLHAPSATDGGVRDIAIAGDLIRGIDDDHTFMQVVSENPSDLAKHGSFANAWPAKQQDALPLFNNVSNEVHGAIHCPANPTGEANYRARTVTNSRDAIERALDTSAVIPSKSTNPVDDTLNVIMCDLSVTQLYVAPREPHLRRSTEVQHYLQHCFLMTGTLHRLGDAGGQTKQQ